MNGFFDSVISKLPRAALLNLDGRVRRGRPVPAELLPMDPFSAAAPDAPKKPAPETPKEAVPEVSREELWQQCKDVATSPRILDRFVEDLRLAGVVGEDRAAKLLYLAVTSRWFKRPVSVAVKGPSSGGKSHTTKIVLGFFPANAYYELTAMSERALAYSPEPLKNRFVVIYEAAGMKGEMASYLVRSLLSEGCVRYKTVEGTKQGMQSKVIEVEGPTGLITTTTLERLHPENETRLLSVTVNDSAEQTAEILKAIAEERTFDVDLAPWLAFQEWLAGGEHRVVIPYATRLAELIPPVAVRLRRDITTLIALIKAHAILHQATRGKDDQGRIVATIEDYGVIQELLADLFSQGVGASVPATVRETVQAVAALQPEEILESLSALAKALKLNKSTVSRRVQEALSRGYLQNLEPQKGKPFILIVGEPLPDDIEVLPPPERLG